MMDNNFGFFFGSVLRSLLVGASTILGQAVDKILGLLLIISFYFLADRLCEYGECC